MKGVRIVIFTLLLLALLVVPSSGWVIKDFAVDIKVEKDSTLLITETITVDFGYESRHGIFRTIPVKYQRDKLNYSLRLRFLDVFDQRGKGHPYKISGWGRNREIRIGDPNRIVTGINVYNITYRVRRAINYFRQHDELYWNVTGTEWPAPIEQASAKVQLPGEADLSKVKYECFTGFYGSRQCNCYITTEGNTINFFTGYLPPQNGLTIVVGLPKGILQPPGKAQSFYWFLVDNYYLLLAMLIPLITFIFLLNRWFKRGRDPGKGVPIMVSYEPPKELTPAEMGTLIDERANVRDLVATVVDLAVRGYLRIVEIKTAKFFFFSNRDYQFIKLREFESDLDSDLKAHERKFLKGMFGDKTEVKLSDLKNKFYIHLDGIRQAIYQQLTKGRLFTANPDKVRKAYYGSGVLMIILTIGLIVLLVMLLRNITAPLTLVGLAAGLLFSGILVMIFAPLMPRKSKPGVDLARQSLGFKEFVERVEKDRIQRLASDDITIFERFLPYAIVLGVADEWAEKFRGLITQPPQWYESPTYTPGPFYLPVFVNDLGSGLQSMGSTFTSSPSRTAGGGGSGFGGGGFGGGGFGGGGGGAW